MTFFRSFPKLNRPHLRPPSTRFLSHQSPNPSTPPLDEVGPIACRLATRSVVRFRGPDTVKFLQGLLTNDVRPLAHPLNTAAAASSSSSSSSYLSTANVPFKAPPPIYAALLTPQGRFLYDLFLYRPPRREVTLDRTGSGPGADHPEEPFALLADVDAKSMDELLQCLKKYRLRSKVDIEDVKEEFCCWQRFGGNLSTSDQEENKEPEAGAVGWGMSVDRAGTSSAQGNDFGWQWFKDPRLDCLGFRGIFPTSTTPPLVESDKEANEQNYLLWRVERGIAEGSTEIPKGEAIPLEYNLVGLNAISFDKGCYVGQELVARTHHRGVIRKRLIPVKFTHANGEDVEQEVSPGSDVVDCASNKKVGTVNTALGSRGMGLLKLEDAFKESAKLCIKEKGEVKVKAIRPDWWPSDWMQVQEQEVSAA